MRTLKINIITAAFAATISAAWAPGAGAMTLEEGFISPPDFARPHTPYDWTCYMDFADRHGWRTRTAANGGRSNMNGKKEIICQKTTD